MADEEQLKILRQGVAAWNEWREKNPGLRPDLFKAYLEGEDLAGANLAGTDLIEADLCRANLSGANLTGANLGGANLYRADLQKARLSAANLTGANLYAANFRDANLSESILSGAYIIRTDFCDATLTGSWVYGASVWDIKVNEGTKQQDLIITIITDDFDRKLEPDEPDEPIITVDNIEVAQFIYLLLNSQKIRDVIDTLGRKGVLLLGRFIGGRIAVLERLREELRNRGFLPMVFNFDKPEVKDFTETVRLLAGLSHFVIADITNPRSAPLELQATVPECMIPFVPILERGEEPFAMFTDLWIKYREWVFDPIRYPSVDRLIEVLDTKIVRPAQARFADLLARKAERLRVEDI